MKRINKILVVLLLGVTLVVPSFVVSNMKVGAYYTLTGTIGKTRFTAGSTSDTMYLEVETDKGWINTGNGLAVLSTNYTYYYGSKPAVNYILTSPISLHITGTPTSTYPTGAIMVISNTDIAFFDSNWQLLENYVNSALTGYYLLYNLYIDDYFLAYNDGYTTGSSQGYNQGMINYGYYDNVNNIWLTASQYALIKYNEGFGAGTTSGFTDGYADGVIKAYNDGFLSARYEFITNNPTRTDLNIVNDSSGFTYNEGYNQGRADYGLLSNGIWYNYENSYNAGLNDGIGTTYENGFSGLTWDGNPINDQGSYTYGLGVNSSQQDAYNKGYLDGGKNSFMGSFDKWIVPAIIIVIVVGGALSIMAMKRRGD